MNTSVKLNELIVQRSHDASLVIVNLPAPPKAQGDEENCIPSILRVWGNYRLCIIMVGDFPLYIVMSILDTGRKVLFKYYHDIVP